MYLSRVNVEKLKQDEILLGDPVTMSESYCGNQKEFKEFEMWGDHFGLAELIQSGKLRVEQQGKKTVSKVTAFLQKSLK